VLARSRSQLGWVRHHLGKPDVALRMVALRHHFNTEKPVSFVTSRPALRTLAEGGFQGAALGDLGYRGERLANVGQALGITVEAIARGRDGRFVPAGICWVV
jgi:hypothetical protein